MPRASRTFRIFVSSTFSDLTEERNALQKHVFPKLRELCMAHGCRFQAIDLRWGIREEASLDQQTMKICLEEIARCQKVTPRPNFIVLLGDRYGWRPLPYQIPSDEFEQILASVTGKEKKLLNKWYWRDDNAVPPVYDLQPRTGRYKQWDNWDAVEKDVRSILARNIAEMSLCEYSRSKYVASATEQEIMRGAFNLQGGHKHVFCFFRKIRNLPQNMTANDFTDLDENGAPDEDAVKKLEKLKSRLRESIPNNIFEYEAEWRNSGPSSEHIESLCCDVLQKLTRVIEAEIAKLVEVDPLEQEIAAHEVFGKERSKFFTGRADILQEIGDYIGGTNPYPLVIWGESGSGKTALMAKAVAQARERHPNSKVILRYIGATAGSADGRALLESLCREIYYRFKFDDYKKNEVSAIQGSGDDESLSRKLKADLYAIPSEYWGLSKTFRHFLTTPESTERRGRLTTILKPERAIIFIDSLDQLSSAHHARNLGWLPSRLPDNIRLIVSTLPGECLSILEAKLPESNVLRLEPLSLDEGTRLLDSWLSAKGVCRTLQKTQRAEILGKFQRCRLPLYLKLAFEEGRRWKSYTRKMAIPSDTAGIIGNLLVRLSSEATHGNTLVSRSLGYLAATRDGLSEDEMLDVLALDKEVVNDFIHRSFHEPPEKRLPVVVWSRLYFDLEPYLIQHSEGATILLGFYHRLFAQVVNAKYLDRESKFDRHMILLAYFGSQDILFEKEGRRVPNGRMASELPYHQICTELWDEMTQTLCDLRFIEAKCAAGMADSLVEDYRAALNALPETRQERQQVLEREAGDKRYINDLIAYAKGENVELHVMPSVSPRTDEENHREVSRIIKNPDRGDRLRAFSQFVNLERNGLMKFAGMPCFCLQHAYNFACAGPVGAAAEALVKTAPQSAMILRRPSWRPPYSASPACLKAFAGHSDRVLGVCITPDAKLGISGGETNDMTVRVWDLETGECTSVLVGHTWRVDSVSVTPDGKRAVSGSADHTIRVWDLETGECIGVLGGHTGSVESVVISADGYKAVSQSLDGTLRIWDLKLSVCLKTLKGHGVLGATLSVTPDGKRAISGSSDKTLRLMDLETGACLKTLVGHIAQVRTVSMTPDAKRAISGSADTTLRIWNLESGECEKVLEGHTDRVTTVSITHDGNRALSGGEDKTIRFWDLETGQCLKIFGGNVSSVSVTPDGAKAISGGRDRFVRVWDLVKGEPSIIHSGHTARVNALAEILDGNKAISGSSDATIRIWDLRKAECMKTLRGHDASVSSVRVPPDGTKVISGGRDLTIRVWHLESGQCPTVIKRQFDFEGVYALDVTLDGRQLLSGSADKIVRIWDLGSTRCLRACRGHTNSVYHVSAVPDARIAISASPDGTIRIWHMGSGQCVRILKAYDLEDVAIGVSPDGRRVVSGGSRWKRIIRIWDIRTGKCLKIIDDDGDRISTVSVTPDGRKIVSATGSILRIWDMESGECVALYQEAARINVVSASSARGYLACGVGDNLNWLEMRNIGLGPSIVSPCRVWRKNPSAKRGKWDNHITALCLWCGRRFPVPRGILDFIRAINREAALTTDQSPCLELPDEAWEEPALLSECPLCHKPIKFNPFIVDNRDRC